jgi:hypothetical protein
MDQGIALMNRLSTRLPIFTLAFVALSTIVALAQSPVSLTEVSSDPFTVGPGQHATEVEPHTFAHGSTIVSAFQTGRIVPGGSTDIGWATSIDGGTTWTHGFLPGITKGEGSGPYDAASDPAVAYDAKHNVWMISTLPVSNSQTPAVLISRSTDGGLTWQNPVSVDPSASSSDKNWIVCDSTSTSKYYGNCYSEWDNPATGDGILMSTSSDGGLTWGTPKATADNSPGIGGQPLVQPNGKVIVPIETNNMSVFSSSNGGQSWSKVTSIASIQSHGDAGGIRSGPLPTAAVDGKGDIVVMWEDCRFRSGCSTNDLVYSASSDGLKWSPVIRVPIDPVGSTVDHFIPGLGIDPATSGKSAHVGITYYYYSNTNCSVSTCKLYVGFISSSNGGTTWNAPVTLAGPMSLNWLPNSQNGLMVGDYIATAFSGGTPHGVFAVAAAKSGSKYNEAMYTAQGLTAEELGPQLSSAGDKPLHHISDPVEFDKPEKGIHPPERKRSAKK